MAMEKDTGNDPSRKVVRYAGALFLLAAASVMVWQMFGPSWFKNIKAEITDQPYARTITVTGEGKANAKPDIADVSLSVVSKGSSVKQVTTDNNTKMNQVIAAVQGLGVDPKDITTSQYDLNPEYDYTNPSTSGGYKILGYDLTQTVALKVRNLNSVDDILSAATTAGANEVGSLSFDIDDSGPIKTQARAQAFTQAKNLAQEMASEAGVGLGRVVTFSESNPSTPVPMMYDMAMKSVGSAAAPAPSIQPGQKELTVDVSVTYEID